MVFPSKLYIEDDLAYTNAEFTLKRMEESIARKMFRKAHLVAANTAEFLCA
uniref:Uncharacterized protein n=1 Tax=Arundo donax TaxID=35708 RepID=A0A0A9GTL2_ARUDO